MPPVDKRPSGPARVAGLMLATFVLVALVVLGARPGGESATSARSNPGAVTAITDAIIGVFLVAALGAGGVIAFILWPARWRRRKGDEEYELYVEPDRTHWAVKAAFILVPFLLVGGVIAAVIMGGFETSPGAVQAPVGGPAPSSAPVQATRAAVTATPTEGPGWIAFAAAGLLAVILLAAGVWVFRQRRATTADVAAAAEFASPTLTRELAAAVDESLDDLRRERDPRRAVIAAYVRMEGTLGRQGLSRRAVETPSEYAARVLGELSLSARALDGLTHLFELARFSRREIDRPLQDQAIAALTAIREGL